MFYNLGLGKVDQIKRKGSLNSESFLYIDWEISFSSNCAVCSSSSCIAIALPFSYNLIISIISSGLVVKIVTLIVMID